ncbi:MAG: hypothetical protein IJP17_01590, partial [Clostridia bacterium]|nr:hypothetical protein [Clostridia bacterium]
MKENKVLKLAIPFFKERALHRALAVVVAIAVVFGAVGCIGLLSARASDEGVSASDVVPGEVTSPADVPIDGDAVKAPAVKATGMTTPQITMQAPDGALSFNVINETSGAPIYIDWGDGNLVEGAYGANSGTVVNGTVKLYCDADITSLDVKGTDVLAIDASQAEGLESINAANSALMSLNVQGCSALTTLRVEGSNLTELDASGLDNLVNLYANDCALTSLNVDGCSALIYLDASGNIIESIDLGGCESLGTLDVEDNLLTTLDASECTALEELQASYNLLEDIAVNSEMLWGIYANDNLLSAIDLSGAPYIEVLTV